VKEISEDLEKMEIPGAYRAFKLLRPRAFRSDLWRWMVLWKNGGIYMDAKIAFNKTVDWLDFKNDEFVMCAAKDIMYTNNALMAMTQNHPYSLMMI
jgi:mannosyltransferase OCH1-like enzyme